MRHDIRERDREQEEGGDEQSREHVQRPPRVPPGEIAGPPTGSPQRDRADAQEQEAGGDRQQPRVVVTGKTDVLGVVRGFGSADHTQDTEDERERRAEPGRIRG